ncbi:MAG: hypothetical protein ACYSWP_18615, partial [Planctomycetota bacterium]
MCKKLLFPCLIMLLVLAGSTMADPSTYPEGIVIKADVEGTDADSVNDEPGTTQAGWTQIIPFWNLNVNGLGFSVSVESHVSDMTEGREEDGATPAGPKHDVEADLIFGNDQTSPPDNDILLKFLNLRAGYHRVLSYHIRPDEGVVPCPGFELSGDDLDLVVSTPEYFMQD